MTIDKASSDQERIYLDAATEYDELVSAEDADGELPRAIERLATLRGATVADIGAGTGRLTRVCARDAAWIDLVDRAAPMLSVAEARLRALGLSHFAVHRADARELPLESNRYDVVMAGWVFGHFRHWMPQGWRAEVSAALSEMRRIAKAGAALVVVETLGTGHTEPRRHEALDEYFAFLEEEGFSRSAIRTDYVFPDVETAARVTGRFFGEDFATRVRAQSWSRVPECTAVFAQRSSLHTSET